MRNITKRNATTKGLYTYLYIIISVDVPTSQSTEDQQEYKILSLQTWQTKSIA